VTGRATFGDLSRLAASQLDQPLSPLAPVSRRNLAKARAGQLHEVIRSLDDVAAVMSRYCADITSAFTMYPARQLRTLGGWPRAAIQAQEATGYAAGFLRAAQTGSPRRGRSRTTSRAASGLDAAVISLTAGRDLLHTHFATGRDGTRVPRSEWAPVITSAPITRALLLDLGQWARTAARHGARLALSGPPILRGTEEQRRMLNAACQWLWILDANVLEAHRHDPVSAADAELLHAIPVNALEPRRIPAGDETVTRLCQGTTGTAERIRHAAHTAVPQAAWSPVLTADSFRQTAASATVISHNCATVLSSLAVLAQQRGVPDLASDLLTSARAATVARTTWLAAAKAWSRITTDTRGTISPAAAEAADLALWTGRIAYADPGWTPTDSPFSVHRPPHDLAPDPSDLADVVAAVHQACETLTSLAAADHAQIGTAAGAGRLLVPTRSLPDTFDVPHPFAPAPRDRISALLATYHDTRTASVQATVTIADVAADVRAPSRLLTTARAAIRAGPGPDGYPTRAPAMPDVQPSPVRELPGPVERILQDLGVTSTDLLHHAAVIDQAGEQLILDAAQAAEPRHPAFGTASLSRSVGTAEIINHLLASGNPRAATLLRPPPPRAARSASTDPDLYAGTRRRQPDHPVAREFPGREAEP
jgi:hypothetical protein